MKKRPNRTARIERLIKLAELIQLANAELTDNQFEHFLDSMKGFRRSYSCYKTGPSTIKYNDSR